MYYRDGKWYGKVFDDPNIFEPIVDDIGRVKFLFHGDPEGTRRQKAFTKFFFEPKHGAKPVFVFVQRKDGARQKAVVENTDTVQRLLGARKLKRIA